MKLQKKTLKFSKTGGFTLVEMLIVVAILSIVVAIAVPALNTAKRDAQQQRRETIRASLSTAVTRTMLEENFNRYGQRFTFDDIKKYVMVNGRQPANLTELAQSAGGTILTDGGVWMGIYPLKNGRSGWSDNLSITNGKIFNYWWSSGVNNRFR
jgi:prepilin-type N-terminal cleavage/methylation domain-containing protein